MEKSQKDGSLCYNGHILTKKQVEKLNSINFLWTIESIDDLWLIKFNLLKEYLEENNKYPKKDLFDYYNLSTWVQNQRLIFANGKKTKNGNIKYRSFILTKKRIDLLNSIGFKWIIREKSFYKKEIKEKDDMEKVERILIWKLEKLGLLYNKKFISKKDIEFINKKLLEM